MKTANIFESIPDNLDDEFFDLLIKNENITIERIISKGHASPAPAGDDKGWYDQASNEWVIVLKGSAVIAFENDTEVRLGTGDHITIPAHSKHKVKWTDPEAETVWLAVHY